MSSSTSALTSNSRRDRSQRGFDGTGIQYRFARQSEHLPAAAGRTVEESGPGKSRRRNVITQLATFSELSNTTQMAADISTIRAICQASRRRLPQPPQRRPEHRDSPTAVNTQSTAL